MIFKERNLPIFENDFQTVRSRLVSNLSVSSSSLSTSWTFQFYVFLFGYVSFCPVKRIMILIIYWEICVKESIRIQSERSQRANLFLFAACNYCMPCKWRSNGETPSRDKKGVVPFLFQQGAPWNMRSPTATDLLCATYQWTDLLYATYQWTHQQFGVSRWTVVSVLRSCFLVHWGRRQGIHLVSSTGFHEISANFYSREIFIIWPIVKWRYQNGSR